MKSGILLVDGEQTPVKFTMSGSQLSRHSTATHHDPFAGTISGLRRRPVCVLFGDNTAISKAYEREAILISANGQRYRLQYDGRPGSFSATPLLPE